MQFVCSCITKIAAEGPAGDLAEFGVSVGNSFKQLCIFRDLADLKCNLFGFDSFEGLPKPSEHDSTGVWAEGQFAADYESVKSFVNPHGDPTIQLFKGRFDESFSEPDVQKRIGALAFVRIDCDLYQSTVDCLNFLESRLVDGAYLSFDDWVDDGTLGETKAFFEFAERTENRFRFEYLARISIGGMYMRVWHKPVGRSVDPQLLRRLSEDGEFDEAAALLDGVDLDADLPPDFLYYAGVCLLGAGREGRAIDLLKRAASGGFSRFYSAYHLGHCEMRRGNGAQAAYYFTASLIADPSRTDVLAYLEHFVADLDPAVLPATQAGTASAAMAPEVFEIGVATQRSGRLGAAVYYFTTALALDPAWGEARARLVALAPDISLAVLPGIDRDRPPAEAAGTEHPMGEVANFSPPATGKPPTARQLKALANSGRYGKALALLEGVDLAADLPTDFLYYAGVCLGSTDREETAIDLLKRAAAGGSPRFYCAFHLGLFEEKLGNAAEAAYYYTVALILVYARTDIWECLGRVAPDADITLLRKAQAGTPSSPDADITLLRNAQAGTPSADSARAAFDTGSAKQRSGKSGLAAYCLTIALALDPEYEEARARLLRLIPDISLEVLTGIDMDRLAAELRDQLTAPAADEFDLDRKLAWAEAVLEIYMNNVHPSARTLIPALEALFHRALAAGQVDLDTFCVFDHLLYLFYWYWSSTWEEMRGIAEGMMKPAAAAIRDGAVRGLPVIVPHPLGPEPLRLGYLAESAQLGNPVGRGVGDLMELLSLYFPDTYRLVLYAWDKYDDAFLAPLTDQGITVRRFAATPMSERIAAVAEAIGADRIDILITDMNFALPAVLFERRAAPVQIFFQTGLPYWPLANIDGVFRVEFYDPRLDDFEPDICFDLGLGAWQQRGYDYAPPVEPARIAAERARFPDAPTLIGTYGRLAVITPDFLEIIIALLARHPQLVVVLGGTGEGKWIRDFIDARGLAAGRFVLIDEFVDGHVWGHMLDLFLDTSYGATSAGREVMAKGKPIVCMRTPTTERERAPMLIADTPAMYIDLVSRLIEDREFYDAACAATRDFVAAQPGEREYVAAAHDALTTIVRRVRERTAPKHPHDMGSDGEPGG
jgi:hypothetical protein